VTPYPIMRLTLSLSSLLVHVSYFS
jgi:hypothetical protein